MPSDSPDDRQRILLVTGMLGAGKTTALHELEDLGWEAIDNFPVRMLPRLIGRESERDGDAPPLAIGFDSRTRGFAPDAIIERVKQLNDRPDLEVTTLFLDCSSAELQRRFDETRRRHHLAHDMPVEAGIRAERDLVAPLRRWADVLIDTISSFGFAKGVPPAADLVFDMRFLDNPHWNPDLRDFSGLDEPVGAHIERDEGFAASFERIRDLLLDLLPRYAAQGKSYVNIAFGCTGGRHRSVYTVEKMAAALREAGFSPTVLHRNLRSRTAELIEGSHRQ